MVFFNALSGTIFIGIGWLLIGYGLAYIDPIISPPFLILTMSGSIFFI
jgi:hypothetical protein